MRAVSRLICLTCLGLLSQAALAAPVRPQMPQAPFPYHDVEIALDSPYDKDVHLTGTLTVPEGKGPFPAVLLITGSGQQDRDETILGHKPFLVIADYLARRGIASLRVDDRGTGDSKGAVLSSTTESNARDAKAELEALRARPEIDPARVGLIGHSEGGVIAPMLAADPANRIAFIVLLAGIGVRGDIIMQNQSEDIMRAMGAPDNIVAVAVDGQARLADIILKHPDAKTQELLSLLVNAIREISPALDETAARQKVAPLVLPWYRYFMALDPASALTKTRCPVLALNGSKDVQIRASKNLPAIEAALKAGGNRDVTVQSLPGLNHLFQTANTGLMAEYGQIEETFAPSALKIMGDWLETRVRPAAK